MINSASYLQVRKPVVIDAKEEKTCELDEMDASELSRASAALLRSMSDFQQPGECAQYYPKEPDFDLDSLLFGRRVLPSELQPSTSGVSCICAPKRPQSLRGIRKMQVRGRKRDGKVVGDLCRLVQKYANLASEDLHTKVGDDMFAEFNEVHVLLGLIDDIHFMFKYGNPFQSKFYPGIINSYYYCTIPNFEGGFCKSFNY